MMESGHLQGGRPSARRLADQIALDVGLVDALARVRCDKGLTQAEIARRMGVSQSVVARVENGLVDHRLSTLARYAHALGVRIVHVVEEDV